MPSLQTSGRRKRRARTPRRELMLRTGLVRAWDASVFVNAEARHGVRERKPMLCLEIRGDLSEPVKNISSFRLTAFAQAEPAVGAAEIPSVGSIISMRGSLDAVV